MIMSQDYLGLFNIPFIALLVRDLYFHGKPFNFAGLKDRPWSYYIVLFCLVIPVWSIIPASYLYVSYVLHHIFISSNTNNPLHSTWSLFLFIYALCEVVFSIEHHLRLHRLQKHATAPPTDETEMWNLLTRCLGPTSKKEFASQFPRWFFGTPVNRLRADNVREWLCWAFCAKYLEDASKSEQKMIDRMLAYIETTFDLTFLPGYDPRIKSCRLNLDRVEGMGRPLTFYLATSAMGLAMDAVLYWGWGFTYHTTQNGISYWISMPDVVRTEPIVFVHGIGIGLASYIPFLSALRSIAREKGAPLIFPTLPHVSMGLIQKEYPDRDTIIDGLLEILERHGFAGQKATWVGHSLGSVVVGWVCKRNIEVVGRLALVDPICFRLWEADVCYNFVYKTPAGGDELLMWYFVAREIGVSAALGRSFWWFQNVLFPEALSSLTDVHVYLGSSDKIVNPARISEYLIENNIAVTTFPGLGHAGALIGSSKARRRILEFIGDGR